MDNSIPPLSLLKETYSVCRLDYHASIPDWAASSEFTSITRTQDELSIVCPASAVPQGVPCERGWRCLKVAGPLDFSLVGILSRLTTPLAEAGISIFAVSTYDTDYLLVRESDLEKAIQLLPVRKME